MTTDEFQALIKRAEQVLGCKVAAGKNSHSWYAVKRGPIEEDLHSDASFEKVIAKLEEWATPKQPAPVTPVEDLNALILAARKVVGPGMIVRLDHGGWFAYKRGRSEEDLSGGTYEQLIAKLKEWAVPPAPPKPKTIMIEVEVEAAFALVKKPVSWSGSIVRPFWDACREALGAVESKE